MVTLVVVVVEVEVVNGSVDRMNYGGGRDGSIQWYHRFDMRICTFSEGFWGKFSDNTSTFQKKRTVLSERKLLSPETVFQWVTLQKHCFGESNKRAFILIHRQRQEGTGWSRIQETDNVMTPFIKKLSMHTSCPPAGK